MSLDKTNIYFTAQGAPVRAGFVIDFRHARTGLALTMAEALLIENIPEGFTLRGHPGLPGRAAWEVPGHILQVTMQLRRAGFAASPEEIKSPREVPPLPEKKAQDTPAIVQLAPGIILDQSGMLPRDTPEDPLTREELVFNLKSRVSHGRTITEIEFGRLYSDYPEDPPEEVNLYELQDAGLWNEIASVIGDTPDDAHRITCKDGEKETVAGLETKGFKRDTRIFLWFEPGELEFGVSDPRIPDHQDMMDEEGQLYMFIIPKDEHAPYFDDLRGNHLPEEPSYFADNMCENTFSLKPGTDRAMVIADMKARGYIHNPELDGEAGG